MLPEPPNPAHLVKNEMHPSTIRLHLYQLVPIFIFGVILATVIMILFKPMMPSPMPINNVETAERVMAMQGNPGCFILIQIKRASSQSDILVDKEEFRMTAISAGAVNYSIHQYFIYDKLGNGIIAMVGNALFCDSPIP